MGSECFNAIAAAPLVPIYEQPHQGAVLSDELLGGFCATVLHRQGEWLLLNTEYGYSGWAMADRLVLGSQCAERWRASERFCVTAPCVLVQQKPCFSCGSTATLLRGCLVAAAAPPTDNGWQPVATSGGERGFVRCCHLRRYPLRPALRGQTLRDSILLLAHSYLGCSYRWGGKTPLGLDCSGLVSQCYLCHGITMWRNSTMKPGFAVRPITRELLRPADLIYWPGHIALYCGGNRYIHSNATYGGVTVNSFSPHDDDYRADLADSVIAYGRADGVDTSAGS